MQKNLVRKGIVFVILILFVGTSVVPTIRGDGKHFFCVDDDDRGNYRNIEETSQVDIFNKYKFDNSTKTFPSSFDYKERNAVDMPFNNSNNEKTVENVRYLEEEFSSLLEKKIEVKNSDFDRKIGEFLNDNLSLHSFQNDEMSNTEYDFVEVTRWADPTRERALYYNESKQPKEIFENKLFYSSNLRGNLVYLVIDEVLINQGLVDEISMFINDLEVDGYYVNAYVGTYGNPENLKSFLQTAPPDLVGALFVGDIPTAWYYHSNDFNGYGAEFPMDLFYMDLDGIWTDSDLDGVYDGHTGDVDAEIWIGRIDAETLNGDSIELYENYFLKNHEYRVGNLKLPNRALVYVDDDWSSEGIYHSHWEDDHRLLYNYTTYIGHKDGTNAEDYKNRLKWDYDWITVFAHSSSYSHSFRSNYVSNHWVSSEDIENIDPHGLFYNLFACSSARFTEDNYLAGRYLFANTYGIAVIGSTKSGAMLYFDEFYRPLGNGSNLGDSFKDWFNFIAIDGFHDGEISWHYGMVLLGDPTLKPNVPNDLPIAQINLRDYIDVNSTINLIGIARKGLVNSSYFDSYTIEYNIGINPEEWIETGISLQNNGTVEIENATIGWFDTSLTIERFNTLKLTVNNGYGLNTDYRIVLDVNNIEFLDPINNDFKKSGENISIVGTVMGTNFNNYVIEYGVGLEPVEWVSNGITLTNNGLTLIAGGELAVWNTSHISQADYFILRLTRNDFDGLQVMENITIVLDPDYLVGWPQKVDYRLIAQSVGVGDVDNDLFSEIFAGESRYGFYDMDMYGWHYNGSNLDGWPITNIASDIRSAPALSDIDGDNDLEIFVGTRWGRVEGWHHDGSRVIGWPVYCNGEISSAITIGDLDNNGDLEIIAGSSEGYLYAWHHNGLLCSGFPIFTDSSIFESPAIGDIDGDGNLEIIVGCVDGSVYVWHHDGSTMPGWPKSTDNYGHSAPVLGDIDSDGDIEIVLGSDRLYVWEYNGNPVSGWPQDVSFSHSSPALGDIDSDGDLEIVASGWRSGRGLYLNVLNGDGTDVVGWPIYLPSIGDSSPIIGDIDGDRDMEILISTDNYRDELYALHHDGSFVSGWPKIIPKIDSFSGSHWIKRSSPVLADIDSDGDIEIILGDEGFLFVWDLNGSYNPSCIEWGMFQHDNQHTGTYTSPTFYVDDDFNSSTPGWQIDHFDNIQDAIDIIPMGGTVFVYNGIYNENIIIGKNLDLIGENENNVIVNGDVVGTVVHVYADQVKISGFKIQNGNYGIILDSSDNIISDNNVFNNYYGIRLLSSNNNILKNNISNNNYGIWLSSSNQNTISDNTIVDNIDYGIYIYFSSNNNNIYHNNLIQNNQNAYDQCTNAWDNGYSIGGNYWDDYPGIDNNGDGIGDIPYYISGSSNQDNYPLMQKFPF